MQSLRVFLNWLFLKIRVLPNFLLYFHIKSLNVFGLCSLQAFIPLVKQFLEFIFRILLNLLHILINVNPENPIPMDFGIIFFDVPFFGEPRESPCRMRNVNAAIDSAFHACKDFASSRSTGETYI